ncbi:MAG: ATP-binding protein [Myxococcota bacterium]
MAFVSRSLEPTLRRAVRTFPAVLLTGARQTGKTTLLRERFSSTHRYLSLERPDVRARALADPLGFFEENPPPLILDEIQRAPELLHYLKDWIDSDRRPGRWLLTGSQTLALMRDVSQTLAGRIAVLTLDPFSVSETLGIGALDVDECLSRIFGGKAAPTKVRAGRKALADWLLRGGFPEIRLHPRADRHLWLSSYVQTYLERDVRDLLRVGDLRSFGRFLGLVAARSGTLLNMADLGRDAGVTGPTAKSWLSVLEASQLVYLLRPHHASFGKRLVKSPKLYLLDTGLVTYLTGIHSAEAALQSASAGALVETAVVAEWVKLFRQNGEQPPLTFWRSSAGDEVDLVIERGGQLYGLEVKATSTPTPYHANGLSRWLDLAGASAKGALACNVSRPLALRPQLRAVPWHPW